MIEQRMAGTATSTSESINVYDMQCNKRLQKNMNVTLQMLSEESENKRLQKNLNVTLQMPSEQSEIDNVLAAKEPLIAVLSLADGPAAWSIDLNHFKHAGTMTPPRAMHITTQYTSLDPLSRDY